MAIGVADRTSNKNEQVVHAAEVIGRSSLKAEVFRAIYAGKRKIKNVEELMKSTRLTRKAVLTAGKALADNDLVHQTKDGSITAYEKIEFFQRYRDRILSLATDENKREKVPTKRNNGSTSRGKPDIRVKIDIKLPRKRVLAKQITVDDIESFSKVTSVPNAEYIKMPETKFKAGIAAILNEQGQFNDWGGELRDLSSTRLKISGKRKTVAFAFKGPGTTGRLTPGKLGKNGDQIQRLATCPADVYLIQYWAEIDDSVLDQLQKFIELKAYLQGREFWYGIIDGQDSARIIKAYPGKFGIKKS